VKRAYERQEAEAMRPLLEAIARELEERNEAIERLTRATERRSARGADARSIANATAQLATHKREHRRALAEIEALGCTTDPNDPSTVLVPGPDGTLSSGFEMFLGAREATAI
jgi:phosphoketolase